MTLTPERRLLLLVSRSRLDESQKEELRATLRAGLDWKELLYQAATHRLMNLFWHHVREASAVELVERDLRNLFALHSAAIGAKNRLYFAELKAISAAFRARDLVAPLLKGPLLAATVYPSLETRYFNDLDFLVCIEDVPRVIEAMESVGYVQGQYDEVTGVITPATRRQKIFHQMSTHELQMFVKATGQPLAPILEIDMNHSILWVGNCPYQVDTHALVARATTVEIEGAPVHRLDHEDCLLQLCSHLYREATLLHWIGDARDLKIYKFADIQNYVTVHAEQIDWDRLVRRVKEYGLEKVVYWTSHHVEALYGPSALSSAAARLRPSDLGFLDEYAMNEEKPRRWSNPFLERLFDSRRVAEAMAEGAGTRAFEEMKGRA